MARPQATLDLCHVPTPPPVIDQIAEALEIHPKTIALDPCCGDGSALARLCPTQQKYGIELDLARAEEASKRLTKVLACATEEARLSRGAFGLVLLNPPYDVSTSGRLELVFLRRARHWLAPGGVLVFIVKETMYNDFAVKAELERNYDLIAHWRFPRPWYDGPALSFRQTVLIARRRRPGTAGVVEIPHPGFIPERGGVLDVLGERWKPVCGSSPDTFISIKMTDEQLAELLATSPLPRTKPTSGLVCGRPPLPLRTGHVALVLASGRIDGVYREDDDASLHVAKGTVVRAKHQKVTPTETAGGRLAVEVAVTDTFTICIRTIDRNGNIQTLSGSPVGVNDGEPDEDGE